MKKLLIVLPLIALISACEKSPESVAQQYWRGILDNNESLVADNASQRSKRELFTTIAPDEGSSVKFGETKIEADRAQVDTILTWVDEEKEQSTEFNLQTVLVKEDDGWKVDTARTRQQFFTAVYRGSLDGLSSVLAESLANFQVLGEEMAGAMAQDISAAIDELEQESAEAGKELQEFLQSLDKDLSEAIESINQ